MKSLLLILFLALTAGHGRAASLLETMFSYQGFLSVNGSPANSNYDMMFTLFRVGEPMPGPSVTVSNVPVVRGLFTAGVDFGPGVFDGTAHELSVAVREAGGGGPFAPLQPRQPLRATPNASFALTVGTVPDTALSSNVALLNGSPMFSSPISVTLLRVADAGGAGLLRFGPTDDCTVGVDPQGASGLLLRDPRGIRLLSPDPMSPPVLRFGPTDDCSIGIDPALTGLRLRDPGGLRIAPTSPMALPRLLFGPTDDCSIGVDPALAGLLLRDPRGVRVLSPDQMRPPTLLFGPTDDCSIGIDPALTGLRLRDPGGLRIAPTSPVALPRLLFGPTDDCSIGVDPALAGLLLRDPRGVRVLSPDQMRPPTLLFGPTDDCSIGIDPALTGLRLRDPGGLRIAPTSPLTPPLLRFGPTDDCTIGVAPTLGGLLLRDPRGIRILSPVPTNGTNAILFGPTDDCRILAPGPNGGMGFSDPRGFTFGSQVTVNGPVFAQAFIQTSSRRFKDDVKPLEKPLEKIAQLQGVRFTWSEDKGGRDDIGFIAEDVAKVIPEVVAWEEDRQNARGVNYDHLVAVAIEGIKAQQSQIQTLEREKAELKDNLATVHARLDRLSRQMDALLAR